MKVKVRTEFKDKHTGKLHKAGDELEMNVDRINEVLKVGNFIELVAEPKKSETDKKEQAEDADTEVDQKDTSEDAPKTTGRRKRTGK